MEHMFDNATMVPGVIDNGDPTTRQVPTFVMKESQSSNEPTVSGDPAASSVSTVTAFAPS
jgi:hypothetical protein